MRSVVRSAIFRRNTKLSCIAPKKCLGRILRNASILISIVWLTACASQPAPKVNIYNQLNLETVFLEAPSPLIQAAKSGSRDRVVQALEQGELINAISPEGTAFSVALRSGFSNISTFLISMGANWQHGFAPGEESALISASRRAMNKVVEALLIRDVEINYTDDEGYSALAKAAINGHLTTVKILIAADANVNVTPDGRSLLMHVVEDDNMLISQLLIQAGADVNFRDENGTSALQIARQKGLFDLDLMLVQAGARP